MMNWMRYLLEANLYLLVFYLLYRLLLSRETHYALSRSYLLFTSVVAFIIPILQLGFLKPAVIIQTTVMVNLPTGTEGHATAVALHAQTPEFSLTNGFTYFYLAGALVFLLLLIVKLARLSALGRSGKKNTEHGYKLVEIPGSAIAFSFFNKLYIGADTSEKETIIRHELVHINQKHSADIMLMEVIRVFCWFNPVVYLVQNDLKAVHEYIADEKAAAAEQSLLDYSAFLVNNAYGIGGPSVTQSFFNKNLLKNRIMMLNKKPSGNLAMLKYLFTLPLLAALMGVSTLAFSKTYGWVDLAPRHLKTNSYPGPYVRQSRHDTNTFKYKGKSFVYKNGNTTSKGYSYKETGYVVNGKTDFRVIITKKDGKQTVYLKSDCTPAEIKMLNEKYGYTFPSMDIFTKLPPPPPAPGPPAKPDGPSTVKSPPPPPQNPFDSLYKYIARNVRYPQSARSNKVAGKVIINFNIIDGKIQDVTMPRGLFADIDAEAMRVMNNYKDPLNVKSANYNIAIAFALIDAAGNYVGGAPKTNNNTAIGPKTKTAHYDHSYMLDEVVVSSYLQ
jgi:hypothetical protein